MDCSQPGFSAHGISQAILEWVAISLTGGFSQPRDQTQVSARAGGSFTTEPPGKQQADSGQLSSVQSLSRVRLFVTPWTEAHQASRSITNSQSLLELMSIERDAIQPSHPLSSPSPPIFNLSQHQGLF